MTLTTSPICPKRSNVSKRITGKQTNNTAELKAILKACEILDNEIPLNNGKSYKEQITFVPDRPGHDYRYAIDASKIKTELSWSPRENFLTGIKKTILWYLDNRSWWESIKRNKYQLERLGLEKE